jgi:hypothetical protein
MKPLLLSALLILSINSAFSQTVTETKRAQAGENVSQFVSENGVYRFPKFATGIYITKEGKVGPMTCNYNLVIGEMQYMNGNDTVSISNPLDFDLFKVNDVVFYFRDGYKEIVQDYGTYKLGMGIEINVTTENIAAYGSAAGASKVSTLSHFDRTVVTELKSKVNSLITKKTTYYILDKDKLAEPATKKNFTKIFSNVPVADFLRRNSINFNKVDDLKKLLKFCSTKAQS